MFLKGAPIPNEMSINVARNQKDQGGDIYAIVPLNIEYFIESLQS